MAALLSGCIDSVGLQREYVASRDNCREMAEMKMGLYVQPQGFPVSEKEKNAMLLALFSECMRGESWAVAKPKEPKEPPPATPPAEGKQVAGVPPVGNTLPISSALVKPGAPGAPAQQYMLVPVPQQPVAAPAAPASPGAQYNPAVQPMTTAPTTTIPPTQQAGPPAVLAPVVVPVAPVAQQQPKAQQPKTVLRNKGIGVGVGPTYSLEKMIEKE